MRLYIRHVSTVWAKSVEHETVTLAVSCIMSQLSVDDFGCSLASVGLVEHLRCGSYMNTVCREIAVKTVNLAVFRLFYLCRYSVINCWGNVADNIVGDIVGFYWLWRVLHRSEFYRMFGALIHVTDKMNRFRLVSVQDFRWPWCNV